MSGYSEATTSQPVQESKSYHDSTQADSLELNPQSEYKEQENVKNEREPLFIEDRTKNFQLHHPIQYESRLNASRLDEKQNTSNQKQNNACWNCNSANHSLHRCTAPRNQRKISQNRQTFLMQKQQGGRNSRNRYGYQKNNRYFINGDLSIFGKFTPGQMSKELSQALNVPRNGIPLHVYYMRETGYPNGWLIDAREEYSGISIFTSPDECVPFPGKEENENNEIFFCNINKRKLHEYPGFNAPCPPNFVDNYKKLGCPIYNPDQSLELMYKRLKAKSIVKISTKKEIHENNSITEYVDIASNSKDTYINSTIFNEVKPPSSPEDGEITDEGKVDICLNEAGVQSPCTETNDNVAEKPDDDENHSDTFLSSVNDTIDSVNGTQLSLSDPINADNESGLMPSSSKRKFGDIKSEVLGTPVLKSISIYENRPTHDHFAKGMVDLIDHENLPNAVGTFNKIKEILKDVRETLNNLI